MPRKYKHWKSKEVQALIKLYNRGHSYDYIASCLERPVSTIAQRIKDLSKEGILKHRRNYWTQEERDYLIKHYRTSSAAAIGIVLERSTYAIYLQWQYLNKHHGTTIDRSTIQN